LLRPLVIALAINLACVLGLFWSTTEQLHVTVLVFGGSVTGIVGGTSVTAPAEGLDAGEAGLFLQGADPHATIVWPAAGDTTGSTAPSIGEWFYRLASESAWTNIRVKDLTTNAVLYPTSEPTTGLALAGTDWRPRFGDWFHHPLGGETTPRPGLAAFGSSGWHAYQLDADVLRPRNAAGVLVLSPNGTDGMLFYFRPEDRDAMWFRVRDGQWEGPVASAQFHTFHQGAVASVQDVVRLALGGYPGALAISLVALILGMLEAAVLSRRRRTLTRGLDGTNGIGRRVGSVVRRAPNLTALLLVAVALASTLYVADEVLQRMPHVQDSVAYLFQAKTFALGRLWVPMSSDPQFFQHEFILMQGGRWFSKYTPGWPLLLSVGVLAHAPWVVDPICGALSIFVIYRLGAEIYRPRVGLIAAALGVVSPFFVFLSGSMMSHASGLLFALLFVWGIWRASRSPRPIVPSALSGVAFGIGFLIRPYTMVVIAIPFALYALWGISRLPKDGLGRYLPAAIATVPFIGAFLAYNAYFTGNPLYPPQQLWWAFDSVGFGPQHGPWGFTPIDALNNTSRNLLELVEHTDGWPEFLTLSFAMLPFLVGRFRSWDWLFAGGFVALVAGYGLWWADGIMYGPRFYYEGLGFLLLLTARGVDEGLDLARYGPTATRRAASPAATSPALASVGLPFGLRPVGQGVVERLDGGALYPLTPFSRGDLSVPVPRPTPTGNGQEKSSPTTQPPHPLPYEPTLGYLPVSAPRSTIGRSLERFRLLRGRRATPSRALSPDPLLQWEQSRDAGKEPEPDPSATGGRSAASPVAGQMSRRPAVAGTDDEGTSSLETGIMGPRVTPSRFAPALIYAFVALLIAFNFVFYFPGQWQLYHGYNYVDHSKLDAVQRAGIHHALVFADVGQSYEWWEYGMVFSANDPLLQGDVIFARDLGDAADKKLMADFPGRSYYRLDGVTLSRLDTGGGGG